MAAVITVMSPGAHLRVVVARCQGLPLASLWHLASALTSTMMLHCITLSTPLLVDSESMSCASVALIFAILIFGIVF